MQLIDAIFLVGQMTEDSVICARRPFVLTTEAVIAQFTNELRVPIEVKVNGYEYFLESSGVEELLEMVGKKLSSRETKAELVCYYAENDAYPSWLYDLPDA